MSNEDTNKSSSLNILTPTELMKELGVSRRTLRRWQLAGMLPAIVLNPRVVRYRRCDVEAMLERFTTGR